MKVLVVGNYFYPEHTGGVEIVSYNLVKQYKQLNHEVHWLAADVRPATRVIGAGDIPIRSWNYTEEKLGFPSPLPWPGEFYKIFKSVQWCDVVHLQDCLYPINILVFIVSKILRKPVLITQYAKFIPYRQLYKRFLQNVAYRTIGRLMFGLADHVVFITKNVLDNMRNINPQKLWEIVPLGVDTDFFSPLPQDERQRIREQLVGERDRPIVLFVGRMVERKGVHLIRPLVEKYKEWHWVFVGRPDDYNPAEWDLSNLHYFQYASEEKLRTIYGACDVLVHPSMGEGITLTISESLASGTPVVISEEALYEVEEEDRFLFVAVQPETTSIESAIKYMLSDPERLKELRINSRQFAQRRLSWKKMAITYSNILESIFHD